MFRHSCGQRPRLCRKAVFLLIRFTRCERIGTVVQLVASRWAFETGCRGRDLKFGEIVLDWRDKSACLSVDPELFFPVGNTGPAVEQIDRAKAVCSRCPVTEYCLQYALDTNQDSGVWGGLSEDERRALKRRAARARRAS